MKALGPLSSLLPFSLLFILLPSSHAVPSSSYTDAQAVFSQKPFLGVSEDKFEGKAMDGRFRNGHSAKNLERWNYEGKEYIKQDNLLCENHLFANVLGADIQ